MSWLDGTYSCSVWTEEIETNTAPIATFTDDGSGAIYRFGNATSGLDTYYLAFWPLAVPAQNNTAGIPQPSPATHESFHAKSDARDFLFDFLGALCEDAGVTTIPALPYAVRVQQRGSLFFAFNYGEEQVRSPAPPQAEFVLGGAVLPANGVCAWLQA